MTTPTTTPPQYEVRYDGRASKTLRDYADRHADKIVEVYGGSGYSTDSGLAWDILLRPGWSLCDDAVHTLIEPTVETMLAQLRAITQCDCDNCKVEARLAHEKFGHPIPAWL